MVGERIGEARGGLANGADRFREMREEPGGS
jgi:hypothetical protein